MRAELLNDERYVIGSDAVAEIVIWRLPEPLAGSRHFLKYRLAFVANGRCVLRYDNETGKGDHRHARGRVRPYRFAGYNQLLADFWSEVDKWWRDHEDRND